MQKHTSPQYLFVCSAIVGMLVLARSASADTITLLWDPNPEQVAGYIVHVGTQSGTFTEHYDVGLTTTWPYATAVAGQRYCFAVSAYFAGPLEGPMSNEVCGYSNTPTLTNPGTQTSTLGQPATLQLSGTDPNGSPLSYSASGIPPGLFLMTGTGFISGTPTTAGTFTVTATASNSDTTSAPQTFTWSVVAQDGTAPVITITSPTTATTYTTGAATLALGGTASDNVGVTSVTWVSSRGGSGTATGTTSWSIANIALQGGTNVLTVTARDAAGHTASDALTVTVSTTNTAPALTSIPNQSGTVGLATTLQLSGSDANGDRLTYGATGLPPGLSLNTSTGLISGTPTTAGTFNVTASVSDGSLSASRSFVWTVTSGSGDRTAPVVSITSPTSATTYSTTSLSVTLRGTASDNVGVTQVRWANNRGGSGTATGTTSWSTAITLQGGSNVLTITARDAAGNSSTDTLTVTVTSGDTTLPNVSITTPTTATSYTTASATLSLGGTASDNVGVTQVSWTNDRGGSGTASGTANWTAGVALQNGVNVVTVTARDAAGNTRTDSLTVTANLPLRVTLSSDRPAPQVVGTSIRFTASASGGTAPYQYRWWRFDGAQWTTLVAWGTSSSYTWTPTTRNSGYQIRVEVRDSTGTQTASATMSYPIN